MSRRRAPQLFEAPPQDAAGEESESLYALVVWLRRRGKTVTRAGADHLVNGKRLSTWELRRFCELLAQLDAGP